MLPGLPLIHSSAARARRMGSCVLPRHNTPAAPLRRGVRKGAMRGVTRRRGRGAVRQAWLALLLLGPFFCQAALAREDVRLANLPRDFQSWAIWRADDASLSETAKGPSPVQALHGADFCLGAMLDAGTVRGMAGGLPLHAMAYCPTIVAALRSIGQETRAFRPVSTDRPSPSLPTVSQSMCSPVIRNR